MQVGNLPVHLDTDIDTVMERLGSGAGRPEKRVTA